MFEVPKLLFIESLSDVSTDMRRQTSMIVQKQVPAVEVGQKFVEDAQAYFTDRVMNAHRRGDRCRLSCSTRL